MVSTSDLYLHIIGANNRRHFSHLAASAAADQILGWTLGLFWHLDLGLSPGHRLIVGLGLSPGHRLIVGLGLSPGHRLIVGLGLRPGHPLIIGFGQSVCQTW